LDNLSIPSFKFNATTECYGPWMFNVQRKNISGKKVSKTNGSDGKRRLVKRPE